MWTSDIEKALEAFKEEHNIWVTLIESITPCYRGIMFKLTNGEVFCWTEK